MALFNEILQGRYNALLTRLMAMKGGSPAPQLSPEIQMVLAIESERPEWQALMHARLCWASSSVAAGGVGTRARTALLNPAASGVLVVVEEALGIGGTNVLFSYGAADLATAEATEGFRDSRWFAAGSPTARLSSTNVGAAAPTAAFYKPSGQALTRPIVLFPGNSLVLNVGTDDTALVTSWAWLERAFDAGENFTV